MSGRNHRLWVSGFRILEETVNGVRSHTTQPNSVATATNLRKLLKQIDERGQENPSRCMVPVAQEVLQARTALYAGVSMLVQHIPVWTCKCCSEVYIDVGGHLIKTCHGYQHHAKNKVHNWIKGGVNDVLVPVEAFHLPRTSQKIVKHDERFDYERIPAVVELCLQAGVDSNQESFSSTAAESDSLGSDASDPEPLSDDKLRLLGTRTLRAWEALRSGVYKLLCVHPTRVCKHCSEVHIGRSGHDARMCGVFKHEAWRGKHFWQKAKVDNLVPPNVVWFRRRQDPPILINKGRDYYGHAPAVVDLCSKAGAMVPSKYFAMMKLEGMTAPAELSVTWGKK